MASELVQPFCENPIKGRPASVQAKRRERSMSVYLSHAKVRNSFASKGFLAEEDGKVEFEITDQ